jgi:hypothetical protein
MARRARESGKKLLRAASDELGLTTPRPVQTRARRSVKKPRPKVKKH